MEKNIYREKYYIDKKDRKEKNRHASAILWLTGLSGSGKSTIAKTIEKKLFDMNISCYVLDGDNIRLGLNSNLGFSKADREENIRRIGEVAKLFVDAGMITVTAFISPFRKDRDLVRRIVEKGEFIEIYIRCPLEECEKRDVKGLYKKARNGEIREFTGIDSPYEEPLSPDLIVDTKEKSANESADFIIDYLRRKGLLNGLS